MFQRNWRGWCSLVMVSCVFTDMIGAWTGRPAPAAQTRAARGHAAKAPPSVMDQVDTQSSRVYVHVGKTGLGHEHAIVGKIRGGQIHLGASRNAGTIVFDMASFAADTAAARRYIGLHGTSSSSTQQAVTANMRGPDVLNVQRYPTATFAIASALPLKASDPRRNTRYQFDGKFTLHGVTRPLRLRVEVDRQNGKVRLRTRFSIRQTDFGMTPYSKAFGAIGVADRLTIHSEVFVARGGGQGPSSS